MLLTAIEEDIVRGAPRSVELGSVRAPAPWCSARRLRAQIAVGVLLLAIAGGLASTGPDWAEGSTPGPSGSSTISQGSVPASGTGSVSVHWSALRPNEKGDSTHYWYVESNAYHEDGTHANYRSTAEYGGVISDSRTHNLVLQLAPGLRQETFRVVVTLACFPNPDTVIGGYSITLVRNSGGGSGSGSGSGGGSGSGSGGAGGGGSNPPGSAGGGIHCIVPKLAGKTLTAARKRLERAHCKLGKATAPKARRGVKLVVRSSSPRAGARLPSGAKVNVKLRKA